MPFNRMVERKEILHETSCIYVTVCEAVSALIAAIYLRRNSSRGDDIQTG